MSKGKNWLKVAVGAAAGFVVGILTAPKSGKETRREIKKQAKKWSTEGEKKLKSLYKFMTTQVKHLEIKSHNLQGKAKHEVDDLISKAKFIRDRAKQMISDIHDGLASEQDVATTIKDGEEAKRDIHAARQAKK